MFAYPARRTLRVCEVLFEGRVGPNQILTRQDATNTCSVCHDVKQLLDQYAPACCDRAASHVRRRRRAVAARLARTNRRLRRGRRRDGAAQESDLALPRVVGRLTQDASSLLGGMKTHTVLRGDEVETPLRLALKLACALEDLWRRAVRFCSNQRVY